MNLCYRRMKEALRIVSEQAIRRGVLLMSIILPVKRHYVLMSSATS